MVWDYCEANPFGISSANFASCTSIAADCIAAAPCLGASIIEQRAAQTAAGIKDKHILVSTDPPYYDNVGYADLADFFHGWLRRALREIIVGAGEIRQGLALLDTVLEHQIHALSGALDEATLG